MVLAFNTELTTAEGNDDDDGVGEPLRTLKGEEIEVRCGESCFSQGLQQQSAVDREWSMR